MMTRMMMMMMINESDGNDYTHTGRVFSVSAICLIKNSSLSWYPLTRPGQKQMKQIERKINAKHDHVKVDTLRRIMCGVHYKGVQPDAAYLLCILL